MTDQIPFHQHNQTDGSEKLDPRVCFASGFAIFDHIPTLDEYNPPEGIPFMAFNGTKYVLMAVIGGVQVDLTGA